MNASTQAIVAFFTSGWNYISDPVHMTVALWLIGICLVLSFVFELAKLFVQAIAHMVRSFRQSHRRAMNRVQAARRREGESWESKLARADREAHTQTFDQVHDQV